MDAELHKTSLAVWDVASPVVLSGRATMKVGVKCSAGCELSNHEVELRDESDNVNARALLGTQTWPGTAGLYWTKIDFLAPSTTGTHQLRVTCAHGDARLDITCITVPRPECSLTIQIRDEGTCATVGDVDVRLGVYRASTDPQGQAKIEVPRGSYSLTAWKMGYELVTTEVVISETHTLDVVLVKEVQATQPYWM